MNHKAKIKAFLENTKRLNKRFGITPLLYGSLGLEYVTGEDFSADDIDILIPEIYLRDKWETFRRYLETLGYELIDEHEHTFQKDGNSFSYARLEELRSFCGINASDIEAKSIDNISFMILSPEQYLTVYKQSSKDGYRKNVKENNDNEKILRIEAFLKAKEKETLRKQRERSGSLLTRDPHMRSRCRFSRAQLYATLWTVACQTPLSMGLSANFSLETRMARR